ncbi:uncharacterized protein LOC113387707 isoform X2 [Ctenocephalides felis]|uniref:uncharacterized protein LOC113387707 isoform X2 n=1 Tax=Ctenocephalides felis TaxID=7515 RepID=UPI000E6E2E05|nr:uncharacterized protein LOC113387707 isoform X2 [Ctenocephalides felis]
MIALDQSKPTFLDIYKMDLAETMKAVLANKHSNMSSQMGAHSGVSDTPGTGYVTEKLYMLLQLYLQNKGWSPSVELLQCFTELKDSAMLPNAAYLQVLASRVALDSQGRLVLRDSGKIVLPFEHFANAVMLKHMGGPHGLHLGIEATVRAVMDSYTIGRENLGMEKDFIVEVVQSCPSPACRYYKGHLNAPMGSTSNTFMTPEPPHTPQNFTSDQFNMSHLGALSAVDLTGPMESPKGSHNASQTPNKGPAQQITAAIIQQQNRAIAQQNLEKFGALSSLEKQRVLQQLDKKQYEPPSTSITSQISQNNIPSPMEHKVSDFLSRTSTSSLDLDTLCSNKDLLALHNGAWGGSSEALGGALGALSGGGVGGDKIVRAFSELMRNIARMKTFIRPSMCKPYGKQSESLQKTLIDTIQLVQSLRSVLPAPHIPVSSWKSEDRHRKDDTAAGLQGLT